MSTTHSTVRIECTVTNRGRNYEPAERYEATAGGWVSGRGSSPGYARGALAATLEAALRDWRQPELVMHGTAVAVVYTRPDGVPGYSLYGEHGKITGTVVVTPPNGQSGPEAEWAATVKAAWHSAVQSATDWHDDTSVWFGWGALTDAGYPDLAADHLQYAGWQRAWKHGYEVLGLRADGTIHTYATEHAHEYIPAMPS